MVFKMEMTSKQRMLAALKNKSPDRLPVTTHHIMPYFLNKYMNGNSIEEFFDYFGLDPILWIAPHKPDKSKGEYYDPEQEKPGFLESRRICTDSWRITSEVLSNTDYKSIRYKFITPQGSLSMVIQANDYTTWVSEYLIKDKKDIELIGNYVTTPKCDVDEVNRMVRAYGERGIVRSHICIFDVFGQGGTWQDACCLVGTERMIMETFDDPNWVHELLNIIYRRKNGYVESMKGARYDIIEHGGGDASSSVISPRIFNEFVAPYDSSLIKTAHETGKKIVYHTCGGMMPIPEDIAAMKPDAMETFTPAGMGGDVDLAEAKRRIGG
jgi:uroporphyrinogen decarboxylase